MRFDSVKKLKGEAFRRVTGVQRSTFEGMEGLLFAAKRRQKAAGGKPNTLCIEDQLLMMLEYWREYRTYLDYPFAGSRMLQTFLVRDGYDVGRLHVATLMKRMGIEAIYRPPNTSKPAPGHAIFPYLLRKLPVTRLNQVWAMDIT